MRTILYILIFILTLSIVGASLSDYPEPFVKDHYADALAFVVSESEVTLYSIVSADIASGLAPVKGNTKTLLDKELLTGYQNYDLIVIGDPCNNKLASKFLSNEYCTFKFGESRIKLMSNGNNKALIIMGYNFDAVRNAGLVLRNYKDYNLIGDDLTIIKEGSKIIVSETSAKAQIRAGTPVSTSTKTTQISASSCNGCMVDKTCVPNEKRLFDEYCQDSVLMKQKENLEECNNDYECASNTCKNNICSKQTILTMILNWVKATFQRFI